MLDQTQSSLSRPIKGGGYIDHLRIGKPPAVVFRTNGFGPSVNDPPEAMANNVLMDGGGGILNQTGGQYFKCPNVQRSLVNKGTCFLSYESTACTATESVGEVSLPAVVCGSIGEVSDDPSLPETFEVHSNVPSSSRITDAAQYDNQKHAVWTEITLYGRDQLRQRMTWSLAQHLTIVPLNIDGSEHTEIFANYHDILVKHAFGNYRDILAEVSYSPLTGEHLTFMQSQSHSYVYRNQAKRISETDGNYAREIMQLFTIGLYQLNDDGTPVLDPLTGKPFETYDNE